MDQVAYGFQTLFVDGGDERREMYIHRVYLSDLDPDTYYGMETLFLNSSLNFTLFSVPLWLLGSVE